MPPKKQTIPNYQVYKYAVIKLINEDDDEERLFECIPDRWFTDETKTSCFWPPKSGKSFTVRAVNCEKPDDSWNIYACIVISDGHLTYNSGFKIVKEKCSQTYNTSSADEQINAEKYRREHPVLALKSGNIEHIFAEPNSASKKQSVAKKDRNVIVSAKKADNGSIPDTCIELTVNSTSDLETNFGEQNIVTMRQHQRENDLNAGDRHEVLAINDDLGIARPENTLNSIKTLTKPPSRVPSRSSAHSGYRSRSVVSSSDGSHSGRSGGSRSGRSSGSRSGRSGGSCSGRSGVSCSGRSGGSRSGRSGGSRSGRSGRSSSARSSCRRSRGTRSEESRSDASYSGLSHSRNSRPRSSLSGGSRSLSSRSNRSRLNRSQSKSDRSSCSSSKSKRFRSNSRSRARTHQHRSHAASRKTSPKSATPDRKNKRHRSSERERHSKRSRIRSPENSRPAKERQSNPKQSSASTPKNSQKRDVGTNHRPTNKNLPQAKLIGRKNSSTENKLTADSTVHDLMKMVQKMNATIEQNSQQLRENDRRLHRMEVTVNKIFVLVGDLNGNCDVLQDELLNEQGFEIPQLPIQSTKELTVMKRKLKNEEFRAFFLRHEREFCCPTKRSTDTSTISKYLMRCISLRVRSKLTLKENGENGTTLFKDYRQVYLFLIDVMKAGYKTAKRTISVDDAHTALRIVWGRSKQQYRESKRKSKPKQK